MWDALKANAAANADRRIEDMCDAARAEDFSVTLGDMRFDYAKTNIDDEARALLIGVLPNIPGFLAQTGVIDSSGFIIDLYNYAWFIGLAISGCGRQGRANGEQRAPISNPTAIRYRCGCQTRQKVLCATDVRL